MHKNNSVKHLIWKALMTISRTWNFQFLSNPLKYSTKLSIKNFNYIIHPEFAAQNIFVVFGPWCLHLTVKLIRKTSLLQNNLSSKTCFVFRGAPWLEKTDKCVQSIKFLFVMSFLGEEKIKSGKRTRSEYLLYLGHCTRNFLFITC